MKCGLSKNISLTSDFKPIATLLSKSPGALRTEYELNSPKTSEKGLKPSQS